MDTKPKLSVIMPVYNASKFLNSAIDSILAQSFTDFEFLIFNDGSTDNSREIIESYKDSRIHFFNDPINKGYVERLNAGIEMAQGMYIARMDADDISMPNRFKVEIDILEKNKGIGVVGSSVALIDADNSFKKRIWNFGALSSEIPSILLFTNYFAHPTVIYRSEIARKIKYDKSYTPSEDYKLWIGMSSYTRLYNIRRPLLFYRQYPQNTGTILQKESRQQVIRILGEQLKNLGIAVSEEKILFHNSLSFDTNHIDATFIKKTKEWYEELFFTNITHRKLNQESLGYALLGRWSMWSKKYKGAAWFLSKTFWSSKIITFFLKNPSSLLKLILKIVMILGNKILLLSINYYEVKSIPLWKKKYLKHHAA